MGYESREPWNNIPFYLVACFILAAVNLTACAPIQQKLTEIQAQQQLEGYRKNLAAGFFENVIKESMQVIEQNETTPPADVAFYALGEVYAHPDYPGRDYNLSRYYFEKLIANFPNSSLSAEARTYISLFEAISEKKVPEIEVKEPSTAVLPGNKPEGFDFRAAIRKNLQILRESGDKKPADAALYNLGLLYAHYANPVKNFKKSESYFHVLIKQFPQSEFIVEAEVIMGLFNTIDKMQQIDIDIEQQKRQLVE